MKFHFFLEFLFFFLICGVYIWDWKDPFRKKANNLFSVSITIRIKTHEIKLKQGRLGQKSQCKIHYTHRPPQHNPWTKNLSKKNEDLQLISEKKKKKGLESPSLHFFKKRLGKPLSEIISVDWIFPWRKDRVVFFSFRLGWKFQD